MGGPPPKKTARPTTQPTISTSPIKMPATAHAAPFSRVPAIAESAVQAKNDREQTGHESEQRDTNRAVTNQRAASSQWFFERWHIPFIAGRIRDATSRQRHCCREFVEADRDLGTASLIVLHRVHNCRSRSDRQPPNSGDDARRRTPGKWRHCRPRAFPCDRRDRAPAWR